MAHAFQPEIRCGYEEAFVEELKGFWSAIVEARPCATPRSTPVAT